jgi:PPM family protein phosphatase
MKSIQSARTNYTIAYATHEGMSGKANEDSLGVFAWKLADGSNLLMGIVADGVGGQIAGEVASRVTVDNVKEYFDQLDAASNINTHLERSILAANRGVYEASQEYPEYQGMSTTVAIAAVVDDRLYTSYVGDSRIYMVRDGRLRQISVDHTWAQEAIEAGLLTRQQAKQHPNRNVIRRHLGGQGEVEVDHRLMLEVGLSAEEAQSRQGTPLRPGDTILICSDGLTDMISDQTVADSLTRHFNNLEAAVNELVDKANQAGGKDNITVVILQMPGGTAPKAIVPVSPDGETVAQAAAAAVPVAAAPVAAAPEARPARPRVATAAPAKTGANRLPLLLAGVVVMVLVVASAVGAFFIFGNGGRETPTEEPTTEAPAVATAGTQVTPQGVATAAVLSPTGEGEIAEPAEETGITGTPALIPTLRATPTNTPPPTRAPTNTPTPTHTPTPEPAAPPSGGPGPQPTTAPPPTETPQPDI